MDNYDELQTVCEKIIALLKNREPGLSTWHEFLVEHCQSATKILLSGGAYCPLCGCTGDPLDEAEKADNPPRGEKKDV